MQAALKIRILQDIRHDFLLFYGVKSTFMKKPFNLYPVKNNNEDIDKQILLIQKLTVQIRSQKKTIEKGLLLFLDKLKGGTRA